MTDMAIRVLPEATDKGGLRNTPTREADRDFQPQETSTGFHRLDEGNASNQRATYPLVLVALRSPVTSKVVGVVLRRLGISSILYSSGTAVLADLQAKHTLAPTLVILEFDLPGVDGEQIIRVLRVQKRFRSTHIVLLHHRLPPTLTWLFFRLHVNTCCALERVKKEPALLTHLFFRLKGIDASFAMPFVQERFHHMINVYISPSLRHVDSDTASFTDRTTT